MSRLSAQEQLALRELARRVRAEFGPRVFELRLFGSRARGEGREDSDLDVLVLLSDLTRADRRLVQDLAFDVGLEYGFAISPLIAEPQAWRADLPLWQEVARDGVPL